MSKAAFTDFLTRALSLLGRYSAQGSLHFVCIDWRHLEELLAAGQTAYSELKNLCVWVKDNGGMGSLYRSQHELVFVFKHGRAPHRNNVMLGVHGRSRSNVWHYPCARSFSRSGDEGNLLALHPTVKPVAMVADAIMDVSSRGEIVLDGFLGSGTTVIAAERTGRRCFGLEFDPLYVDIIIRRWQALTGNHARHALSGSSFAELETEVEGKVDDEGKTRRRLQSRLQEAAAAHAVSKRTIGKPGRKGARLTKPGDLDPGGAQHAPTLEAFERAKLLLRGPVDEGQESDHLTPPSNSARHQPDLSDALRALRRVREQP